MTVTDRYIGENYPVDLISIISDRLSFLRILLIILVVYVHFPLEIEFENAGAVKPAIIAKDTFLRFSVMILTVMSGYIMFGKEQDTKGTRTLAKKVSTLAIPFLVFNVPLVMALFVAQKAGVLSGQRLDLQDASWLTWCDALFACTNRPVNYPLYFLRDLFFVSLIGIFASGFIRKYTFLSLIIAVLVSEYNIDGYLILRTPMLPAFVVGAALAIYRVPLKLLDHGFPLYSVALLAMCILQYFIPSGSGQVAIVVLGGLWAWTLSGKLESTSIWPTCIRLSRFAFPIYLLHGIFIFALLALGMRIEPTPMGLAIWLIAPLLVCVAAALTFTGMRLTAPALVSWATGGRAG